jgi:polyhydroxyalkanoate synthase subunit PhaC
LRLELEHEAAQSTTALGPLVGLAREDFVGAVALLLRETASDPGRTVKHMQGFGEDVVKILTGKRTGPRSQGQAVHGPGVAL